MAYCPQRGAGLHFSICLYPPLCHEILHSGLWSCHVRSCVSSKLVANDGTHSMMIASFSGLLLLLDVWLFWLAHTDNGVKDTRDTLTKAVGVFSGFLVIAGVINLIVSMFEARYSAIACAFALVCGCGGCTLCCRYSAYECPCFCCDCSSGETEDDQVSVLPH